jgi:hypothetical protein
MNYIDFGIGHRMFEELILRQDVDVMRSFEGERRTIFFFFFLFFLAEVKCDKKRVYFSLVSSSGYIWSEYL